MPVTFVTAIYGIPNAYQGLYFYLERFELLLKTGVPILCYLDATLEEQGKILCKKYTNLRIPEYVTLDTSWIPENVILPTNRKHEKDTKEYFAVQLQKAWCLKDAQRYITTSHSAWIDAGIMKVVGFDDLPMIQTYLHVIAESNWPNVMICPGAYTKNLLDAWFAERPGGMFTEWATWQCLGGFLVGPTKGWHELYDKQWALVYNTLPRIAWEVNYWAKLNLFQWYQGDHDFSIVKNILDLREFVPSTQVQVTLVTAVYDAVPATFEQLLGTGLQVVCFMDGVSDEKRKQLCEMYSNLVIVQSTMDVSWIPDQVILPMNRNDSETRASFIRGLQKAWCLSQAAPLVKTTHAAWIDADAYSASLQTICTSRWPNQLLVPGMLSESEAKNYPLHNNLCVRYLSRFLLGPVQSWPGFYEKQVTCVKKHLPYLMWELNYWADMNDICWFKATNSDVFDAILEFRLS
jgi:hypothetical protein